MKVLITGATGLLGNQLGELLVRKNHEVVVVTRNKRSAIEHLHFPAEIIECDLNDSIFDFPIDTDCVVHLAGDNLADGFWSKEKKQRILNSRVKTSENLIESIVLKSKTSQLKLSQIISASAIGIYPYSQDLEFDENSNLGDHFLSNVCQRWEDVFLKAKTRLSGIAFTQARLGVVLSAEGGLLQQLIPIFKMGLGSGLGSGQQWMSWIDIDDATSAFAFLIENKTKNRIFNLVSLYPVTNQEFTESLTSRFGFKIKSPRVPGFILKTLLGEKSILALGSQKVKPMHLVQEGFKFKFDSLNKSIEYQVSTDWKEFTVFQTKQYIDKPITSVFSFFSSAKNLQKITPKSLDFKILRQSTDPVQLGTVIEYALKIHGIPVFWKTKITEYIQDVKFVDNQEKGPYSKWHHTHSFENFGKGTLMKDRVLYKLPLGILGYIVAGWFVKLDVKKIFLFRRKSLSTYLNE